MLAEIEADQISLDEMLDRIDSGIVKLFVTNRLLRLRRQFPLLFARGDYVPLQVIGDRKDHVIAFARHRGELTLIVVVPRLVRRLMRGNDGNGIASSTWGSTRVRLPEGLEVCSAADIFTAQSWPIDLGGELAIADLLDRFPVACILINTEEQGLE